jgi:hypothetical protein
MDEKQRKLLHDVAIVLRWAADHGGHMSLSARHAAQRAQKALGATGGELTAGYEDKLAAALSLPWERLRTSVQADLDHLKAGDLTIASNYGMADALSGVLAKMSGLEGEHGDRD